MVVIIILTVNSISDYIYIGRLSFEKYNLCCLQYICIYLYYIGKYNIRIANIIYTYIHGQNTPRIRQVRDVARGEEQAIKITNLTTTLEFLFSFFIRRDDYTTTIM